MIDLNKTLFIVDGLTEINSLKEKFQKEFSIKGNFRKAPCNGRDVSVEGYVSSISGILHVELNNSYTKIICILDKEKRRQTAFKLSQCIKNEIINLLKEKVNEDELNEKIHVIVADTCFENWIVADIAGIKQTNMVLPSAKQDYFDGKSGVSLLKKILKVPYKKTIHAQLLFKKVSFDTASVYSSSFNQLHQVLF